MGKYVSISAPAPKITLRWKFSLIKKYFLELPYIKQFLSNKIINSKSTNTIYILTVQINYVPKTRIV